MVFWNNYIDSKLLLDVYVWVIIMINFINRIFGYVNSF